MLAVGVVVVLILAFAVINTFVLQPNSQVASVNGVKITRATYDKLRRYNLFNQIQQSNLLSQQGIDPTQSGLTTSSVTDLQTQLLNVSNETTLDTSTITQLVDNEVLRQAAQKDYNLQPSKDDLKARGIKDYVPTATATAAATVVASPTVSGTSAITPTVAPPTPTSAFSPTPTPTYPPVAGAQQTAEATYSQVIAGLSRGTNPVAGDPLCAYGCPGITEDDYLNLIIMPNLLKEDVTDKLASTVPTQTEEIHAQHILTDTEAGATKIIQMLDAGADFTKLANEQSSEQISRSADQKNGGDLGWFPFTGSNYEQDFVAGAWPVPAGQYTKTPVHSSFGYHVIKVLERDPHRALSDTEISTAKANVYQNWLNAALAAASITPSSAAPPPATPVPIYPTAAPAQNTPAGTPAGGTPAPAGTPAGATPSATTKPNS